MAAAGFIVRAESNTAVAILRRRTAQDAVLTANDYVRMGAPVVTIETPSGELFCMGRFDELVNRRPE
jgi:hypothetical protein